jgi:delta24-sterol reductase
MVHPKGDKEEMYVDIGAYGSPTVKNFDHVITTRKIEEFVRNVNGYVCFCQRSHLAKIDRVIC